MENEKVVHSSCLHSNPDVYLDIYKGIDLSKMTLCGTCLRVKVERSHHCRQCQKCILKMDHHCPWLANCIGFCDLKSFILLQFLWNLLMFTCRTYILGKCNRLQYELWLKCRWMLVLHFNLYSQYRTTFLSFMAWYGKLE